MTTLYDKVYEVSGGNPGSVRVIADCLKLASTPQEQFSILSAMESAGWQGNKIWEVFKDEAKQDLEVFLLLLTTAAIATSEMGGDR